MSRHDIVFERVTPSRAVVANSLAETRASAFWIDDARDRHEAHPALQDSIVADLVVVGGGYTGLWTALLAKERNPELRVVLLEGETVGWAASGRNGGFCEASLTHGEENGRTRWPEEMETLNRLGLENLQEIEDAVTRYGIDCDFERTGILSVAVEPHELTWLSEWDEESDSHIHLDEAAVQAEVASPTYLGAVWEKESTALVHPAKLAFGLARVITELGVTIYEHSAVRSIDDAPGGVEIRTAQGRVHAKKAVLATNVFPSLLKRNVLMTIPIYDYVLMTEPLSEAQLESIGWKNRQGISDMANQFHYYRMSKDNRILFGGYDAIYNAGGKVKPEYEERPESFEKLASHFFTTFPQLEGLRFSHKWAGAIDASTRFCAFYGLARKGHVAYASGFTGLGVGSARFAANVMLDLLDGEVTERTALKMVKDRPLPFPPEPVATIGINMTRWSLDRSDHNEGKRNLLLKTMDAMGVGFAS